VFVSAVGGRGWWECFIKGRKWRMSGKRGKEKKKENRRERIRRGFEMGPVESGEYW